MKKAALIIAAFIFTFIACSKNSDSNTTTTTSSDCSTVVASFATNVSPLIQSSCATSSSCHASGSSNGPGALTTYAQIYAARVSIRSQVASGAMPKNGTLSATQKSIITCWVDNGAAND